MNSQKIRDLIGDLESEIQSKVHAINALRSLLESPDDGDLANTTAPQSRPAYSLEARPLRLSSYMELSIKAIESAAKPLHVNDILKFIRTVKGDPNIARRSVEATLIQHLKTKGDESRLIKVFPGTYALRRYPRIEPAA
jgi:hypothetical protein